MIHVSKIRILNRGSQDWRRNFWRLYVASKGTGCTAWSEGEEVVIVSKDKSIYWKKDRDHEGGVDKVVEVGRNRGGEQTSEEMELVVRDSCHGEQY